MNAMRNRLLCGQVRYSLLVSTALLTVPFALSSNAAKAQAPAPKNSVCPFHLTWAPVQRFPIQNDPHASYQYFVFKLTSTTTNYAFALTGAYPYSSWFSWSLYQFNVPGTVDGAASAYISRAQVQPDPGSTNPFVVGKPVLATPRQFTILYLPDGVNAPPPGYQNVTNILHYKATADGLYIIPGRVYGAFPGYNQSGAGGPTQTPYAVISTVDATTGKYQNCQTINVIPKKLITDPSNLTTGGGKASQPDEAQFARILAEASGAKIPPIEDLVSGPLFFQYAPKPHSGLVEFFRPGLTGAPGADVPSVPPPDHCSGYADARLNTKGPNVALVRVPKLPTYFDVTQVNSTTLYPQPDAEYVSAVVYGTSPGVHLSGSPYTDSVADTEIRLDRFGGANFVIWPQSASAAQRTAIFAKAKLARDNVLRGSTSGLLAANALFFRYKGTSQSYPYGITPTQAGPGGPCYQNSVQDGGLPQPWPPFHAVPESYNVYPNMQQAAPVGVQCNIASYISGACEAKLRTYMLSIGDPYYVR